MARRAIPDPLVFGWSWPVFGAAAALATLAASAGARGVGHRRLWILGHLAMALGVAVPVVWPAIGGILIAALLVGGTFMVITMAGMQEGRRVGGADATGLMAAMTSAFAAGQIAGPICVRYAVRSDGDFSAALLLACLLLLVSGGALAAGRAALAGPSRPGV
jgi:hypothetical protein